MPALVWLAYGSLLVLSLLDNLRGPFFPDILSDLQLDGTWGSTFFATSSLFAFVGSWTSHRIVHHRSSLYLLSLSSVALAAGSALISSAHQLGTLLPFCALFGWGVGALNLAQNLMVYEAGAPALRRRLFSGLHSMYGLAALLAPVIASVFRSLGASWRDCFFIIAILPLLVAVISMRMNGKKIFVEPVKRGLARGEWLYCALFSCMMAFYLWGEISASTRMVQWLRADLNYSPNRANFFLGGFSLAILAGRIFFSFVHFKRVDNWRILLISSVFSCGLYWLGLWHSPIWFLPCGLAMSPFFPVAMEQISFTFGKRSAEALGFVLGAGSLSVVLMHLTLGVLTDAFGVGRAMYVGPVSLMLVAIGLAIKSVRSARLESQ